jgi:hypothetical protein
MVSLGTPAAHRDRCEHDPHAASLVEGTGGEVLRFHVQPPVLETGSPGSFSDGGHERTTHPATTVFWSGNHVDDVQPVTARPRARVPNHRVPMAQHDGVWDNRRGE